MRSSGLARLRLSAPQRQSHLGAMLDGHTYGGGFGGFSAIGVVDYRTSVVCEEDAHTGTHWLTDGTLYGGSSHSRRGGRHGGECLGEHVSIDYLPSVLPLCEFLHWLGLVPPTLADL
jgi:hypothetical protein